MSAVPGMEAETIRIQALTRLEEFSDCVELQDAVWGYQPADSVTQKVFLLASRIGGQVIGAYAGVTLVGYAMSLPGVRNSHPYLHSHHLAVLPEWRNAGLGKRLKLAQRDDALARGIELMEWTFDPLEIKNTYLNIARLGAISRRYLRNFYGPSSSPLQGGLPTDRLVAEWWLRSERVERTLRGEPSAAAEENCAGETCVRVPASVYAWKSSPEHRETARELQAKNAAALERAFAQGCAVIGYKRQSNGDGDFVLGRTEEPASY